MSKATETKINWILGPKASIMASAYVKIYSKEQAGSKWINSTLEGYLCLISNRKFQAPLLRLYHPTAC